MTAFDPQEYWEQRLEDNLGLHTVGFLGLGKQYNAWLYRMRRWVFLRTITELPLDLAQCAVLDVGSGTGFYVNLWQEQSASDITGIDIARNVVAELSIRFPACQFAQSDISQDIPFTGGRQFDVISAIDVLFHIVDDESYRQAVQNLYDLLKPGGFLVFSENFIHQETFRARHHVSRSLREIEHLLTEAGFEICSRRPMFVLMNGPADTHSRFYQVLWRGMARIVGLHEVIGFVVGAALYPLEMLLVTVLKESPTTEIIICRKQ